MSKPVTAAFVRSTLRTSPKGDALSAAARSTIEPGARGKVHPEAIAAFNKGRKADRRYAVGATKVVTAAAKAEAKAARVKAAESGVEVGLRGPLPKAAKVALGLSKA